MIIMQQCQRCNIVVNFFASCQVCYHVATTLKYHHQDDQGRTAAHKALEKDSDKGKEVLDIILDKHPSCAKVKDNKGKLPTDR